MCELWQKYFARQDTKHPVKYNDNTTEKTNRIFLNFNCRDMTSELFKINNNNYVL